MRQKESAPLAEASELAALRAKVVALNVARNELIARLAHDIRGPLTSIVGFAELLEEGMDGEAAIDAAKTIRTNAARLTQLTTDLLALNRAEPSELAIESKAVDVVKILADLTPLTDRTPAIVLGDADRLTQAFEQILSNAKKFSSADDVTVTVKDDGDRVCIVIADVGIGIPPEELKSIGQRFYRATNAKKAKLAGTGVGVFIAASIVRAHGGDLRIRSVLGEGTTVEISLPLEHTAHKKSVMLALEDDVTRFYLARELRERGYRVVESGGDVRIDHLPSDYTLADVLETLD